MGTRLTFPEQSKLYATNFICLSVGWGLVELCNTFNQFVSWHVTEWVGLILQYDSES